MSGVLELKKRSVSLDKGGKSRSKLLVVSDATAEDIYEKIKKQING
jgi:uncharacterized protein YggU (UPF0235/DUF167 family)